MGGNRRPHLTPSKMDISSLLSCSFITPRQLHPSALQLYRKAIPTLHTKFSVLQLPVNSSSTQIQTQIEGIHGLWLRLSAEYNRSLANSLGPILVTVIHFLSKYGSQQHATSFLVVLPRSSLAAVRRSACARIKAASSASAVPAPQLMDQVEVVNTFLGYGEVSGEQGH